VIGLLQNGASHAAIAARVGRNQIAVFDICQHLAAGGEPGLASGKRGRKPDEQRLMNVTQEAEIQRPICRHTPDKSRSPGSVLIAQAVAANGKAACTAAPLAFRNQPSGACATPAQMGSGFMMRIVLVAKIGRLYFR
jgi:hypothetical protein